MLLTTYRAGNIDERACLACFHCFNAGEFIVEDWQSGGRAKRFEDTEL